MTAFYVFEDNRYPVPDILTATIEDLTAIKYATGLMAGEIAYSMANPQKMDAAVGTALQWLAEKQAGLPEPKFRKDFAFFPWLTAFLDAEDDSPEVPDADEVATAPKSVPSPPSN